MKKKFEKVIKHYIDWSEYNGVKRTMEEAYKRFVWLVVVTFFLGLGVGVLISI